MDALNSPYIMTRISLRSFADASVQSNLNDKEVLEKLMHSFSNSRLREELLYWDIRTALKWLNYESVSIDNNMHLIFDLGSKLSVDLKSSSFNLIGLGAGSGRKEAELLSKVSIGSNGHTIWYYPIDISSVLLGQAMANAATMFNDARIKIKGIRGDFRELERLSYVYNYSGYKNIFSLFGNTLGNYTESTLFT